MRRLRDRFRINWPVLVFWLAVAAWGLLLGLTVYWWVTGAL